MPEKIISRKHYDVRFLEIPDDIEPSSADAYIDSQIHSIYPGNNGAYEWVYRLFDKKTAIIVFITRNTLENYPKSRPFIPVFLLVSLKKKPEADVLYIHQTDTIEKISFQEGRPVHSQIIEPSTRSAAEYDYGKWLYLNKEDANHSEIDQVLILKLPKLNDTHRFKPVSSSKVLGYRSFYILLIILLLLGAGISFRYSQIMKQSITEHKKLQNQFIRFSNQKAETEKEISLLSEKIKELGSDDIYSPYLLLSALYESTGTSIRIQRITVQNESFSIECISRNPIQVSDALSKNPRFANVSIQRIQDNTNGFKFSLSGSFYE